MTIKYEYIITELHLDKLDEGAGQNNTWVKLGGMKGLCATVHPVGGGGGVSGGMPPQNI